MRGSRIRAGHHSTQRHQLVIQPDRIIQDILAALCLGLDQGLLDLCHFLIKLLARIGNDFCMRIIFQALIQRGNLPADVADLVDGIMGLRDSLTDFYQQIKLLFQVLLRGF